MTEQQEGKVNVTAQVIVLLIAIALLLWGTFNSGSPLDWATGILSLFLICYAIYKILKSHGIK